MKHWQWKRYLAAVLTVMMLMASPGLTLVNGTLIWQEQTAQAAVNIGYYGSQLSGASLDIYEALVENKSNLINQPNIQVTFTQPIAAEEYNGSIAQRAWDAFIYDNPDIFWIDISGTTNQGTGYGDYFYSCTLRLKDTRTGLSSYNSYYKVYPEEIARDQALMRSVVNNVAAEARKRDTRYEQIEFIHEWLAINNRYNKVASENLTSYPLTHQSVSALLPDKEGGPVCDGYSRAFQLICQQLDIPCVIISGTGISNGEAGSHMWNAVQMEDGYWYGVDVTWDDTDGNGGQGVIDTYFLVGDETLVEGKQNFGQTHQGSGVFSANGYRFSLPVLSSRAYVAVSRETTGTELDVKTLAQVKVTVEKAGGNMVCVPKQVDLLVRGTFMNTVTVSFGKASGTPTAIVRVDGQAVTPVPASWSMKDGELTAVVKLTEAGILVPVQIAVKAFDDVAAGAWYQQVVDEAVRNLWMNGTSSTTFDPEGLLTGAQTRAILLRLLGVPAEQTKAGAVWYAGSEQTADELNFAKASIDSNQPQTRANAAMAVTHALTLMGKEESLSTSAVDSLLAPYADTVELDDYTRYALAMLVKSGIMQGTGAGTLAPDEQLTRAQMAALCSRIVAVIEQRQ